MLYGQMYTGTGDYGVYSFSSGATEGFEKVAGIAAEPNCGSVSAGSRFYAFSAEPGEFGKEYAVCVYDANSESHHAYRRIMVNRQAPAGYCL